ncbi:MAG: hypothetical protein ABEH56_03360 [Salinirussus sp.]
MVRGLPSGQDGRSRGQLILVGTITIAVVVVGLTVIVNTVLFTESVGSSSLDSRIQEAGEFDSEVIDGVRSVTFRVGHDSRNVTEDELKANVADNLTLYARLLGESYARSRPVAVSLTYSNQSAVGNRTLQDHDDSLTDNAGDTDWTVVSDHAVGWFSLNLDADETSTDPFFVNATNETSGRWINLTLSRESDGNISVDSEVSFRADATGECEPSNGRVLLDAYRGEGVTGADTCSFNGTSLLDGAINVTVYSGNNGVGKYSVVTRSPVTSHPDCDGLNPDAADPCVAPVLWTANVSTSFVGEGISYTNSYNVSIYSNVSGTGTGLLASTGTVVTGPAGAVGRSDTLDLNVGGALALGNTGDVDSDGRPELPYIDASGDLKVNDTEGEVQTLVDATAVASTEVPDDDKTLLATGTWDGSPASVFYADGDHDEIYRVEPGGSPTLVRDLSSNNGANSVLGIGDIDGDNSDELVYAGSSQEVRYLETGGAVKTTGFTSGSNNGIGNGPLSDLDGDGTAEAVVVDGSNDVRLLDDGGADGTPAQSSVDAAKSPATAADVDDDGEQEIVFVDESSTDLEYVDDVDGTPTVKTLTDPDGNTVSGNKDTGVVS